MMRKGISSGGLRTLAVLTVLLGGVGVSLPVVAADKTKADKKKAAAEPTADDFLGDFDKSKKGGGKASLKDLDSAITPVKPQESASDLAPRAAVQDRSAPVQMGRVLVAAKIKMGPNGCEDPKAQSVKSVEAGAFPFKVNPFSVCTRLESSRGRSMQVTFKILTPKGRLVGSSEEVLDFSGHATIDHVVDYAGVSLPVPGQYIYRLESEGVVMGQQPIFDVKQTANAQAPVPGTATTVDDGVSIGIE